VRAERRVGQLITVERGSGRLASVGGRGGAGSGRGNVGTPGKTKLDKPEDCLPSTLADHGISHDQAAEYARLANADDEVFTGR
jgi:hypothetical protein